MASLVRYNLSSPQQPLRGSLERLHIIPDPRRRSRPQFVASCGTAEHWSPNDPAVGLVRLALELEQEHIVQGSFHVRGANE